MTILAQPHLDEHGTVGTFLKKTLLTYINSIRGSFRTRLLIQESI